MQSHPVKSSKATPHHLALSAVTKTVPPNIQPLEAAALPDALLTLKTVSAVTGLSEPTLYRKAKAGKLKLTRLSSRCTRVHSADLRAFLAAMVEA